MVHRPYHHYIYFFSTLILLSQTRLSWSWYFSSSTKHTDSSYKLSGTYRKMSSEFSMEDLNNKNGIQLIENAKMKMVAPNSCWQAAYQNVFEGCANTLGDEELRSRLAWHLSDCFQMHTGRPSFPYCDSKSTMKKCLKNLDVDAHGIYLRYFLEANAICHQLQSDAFKRETERLVNELKTSAEYAEEKLGTMEEMGDILLWDTKQVQSSVSSIDLRTQQVAKISKEVEENVNSILKSSEAVYEKTEEIAFVQVGLSEGQENMKENLRQGIAFIQESYSQLGLVITDMKNEAIEIEGEICEVGDAMFTKMRNLQSKSNYIGNMTGKSLYKQKELLDGQSMALQGLHFLTEFQYRALEESKATLEKMAEFGHKQQEDLLQKQNELYLSHDQLVKTSKEIIIAQEAFESKQSSMFIAIDKLFTLQRAMLFQSKVIISLFLYSDAIFIIYLLTNIKHVYNVRHRLYLGLWMAFLIEVSIMWCATMDAEWQGTMIRVVRTLFGLLASIQYLYAIFTYRDYEMLNHEILLTLMEKVNSMQRKNEVLSWDVDSDSDIDWHSWMDKDLPEDVDLEEDPDYSFPEKVSKEVSDESENSSVTCCKY